MTDKFQAEAEEYIRKIDEMGGAVKAIETGYMQSEIQNSAYELQVAIEKIGKLFLVLISSRLKKTCGGNTESGS